MPTTSHTTVPDERNLIICWSGDLGKEVAKAVAKWLEGRGGLFRPWYSEDIAKGANWQLVLKDQLRQVKAGIVCVTPGGLGSPWLHYEAGCLAGGLADGEDRILPAGAARRGRAQQDPQARDSSKVFPFLFRVDKAQLTGPLSAYQATTASREDVELLVRSLGELLGEPSAVSAGWEKLKRLLDNIGYESIAEVFPGLERLFRRKTFDEPVSECVSQRWRDRYVGAQMTLEQLRNRQGDVDKRAAPAVAQEYDQLIKALDYYTDSMGTELLHEKTFKSEGRRLKLPASLVSEARRRSVRSHLLRVLQPLDEPVLEPEARLYEKYRSDSEDRGVHLWQRFEGRLTKAKTSGPLFKTVCKGRFSSWGFDRMAWYLAAGRDEELWDREGLINDIERELEIVATSLESEAALPDLRPLHFALWALGRGPADQAEHAPSSFGEAIARARELGEKLAQISEDDLTTRLAVSLVEKAERLSRRLAPELEAR